LALLAAPQQPTDDDRLTDAVSSQLALNEPRILFLVPTRQAPALLAPPSLCGIGKDKRKGPAKQGLKSSNLPEYRPANPVNSVYKQSAQTP
jgi:hypothetical protein